MISGSSKSISIKEFPLGEVIIKEGPSSPKVMIILLQGNIGVYKDYKTTNESFIKSVGQGSFCCEKSLFLNQDQEETLVALSNVVVLLINRENVKDFFIGYPDMAFSIVETIYKRLADATSILDKLQQKTHIQAPSIKSKLFPEEHGSYTLPLTNDKSEMLYATKSTCPLCGQTFDILAVMMSRLKRISTEAEMRVRYKDFEPIYYEIITCPNCLFSAETNSFTDVSKRFTDGINQKTGQYKLDVRIKTGMERDTFTVFAGYYLALLCAPVVFDNYQLTCANLWLKISRLYQDCNDQNLEQYAIKQSLDNYNYVYSNLRISEKQMQQVCFLIANLNYQLNDFETARNYYYMVKTNAAASNVLKRQADNRLEEIRELMKTKQ